MYNYYIYEKKKKEEQRQQREKKKSEEDSIQHKVLTQKLADNYNNRIKRFILELVKQPIVIQDFTTPVETTRKMMMQEETRKEGKKRKDFVFGGFLTEKERIKKYLEEKGLHASLVSREKTKPKTKKDKVIYQQPKMRFRPRTELERIVDSLNHYNYNKKNAEIVKKQMKKLDFTSMKKVKVRQLHKLNYSYNSSNESDSSVSDDGTGKIGQYRNKLIKKQDVSKEKKTHYENLKAANESMRELMSNLHYKTHFKGAQQFSEEYLSKSKKKNMSRSAVNFFPAPRSQSHISICSKDRSENQFENEITNQLGKSILNNFSGKFPINQENFDLIHNNPLLYNLKFGSKSHLELKVDDYENKMKCLKNLMNKKPKTSSNKYANLVKILSSKMKAKKKLNIFNINDSDDDDMTNQKIDDKKGDRVQIDDEIISIKNIDVIANKMLTKCNFIHSKSMANMNTLRKGNGRLMITSGLTVNDFKQKYNI